MLGLLVGLIVFGKLVLGWRWRWIAALAAAVLAAAIVLNPEPFRKMNLDPARPLDAFTAGRTALWRQALAHPPQRPWLGVGLGNGHRAAEILSFELNGQKIQVHHLHNFCWKLGMRPGYWGRRALGVDQRGVRASGPAVGAVVASRPTTGGRVAGGRIGDHGVRAVEFFLYFPSFRLSVSLPWRPELSDRKTGGANAEKVGVAL